MKGKDLRDGQMRDADVNCSVSRWFAPIAVAPLRTIGGAREHTTSPGCTERRPSNARNSRFITPSRQIFRSSCFITLPNLTAETQTQAEACRHRSAQRL